MTDTTDSDEEEVTFNHRCTQCGHIVAEHYFSRAYHEDIDADVLTMECLLCGKGRKVCPRLHVEDENASDANDAEAPTLKDLMAANDVRVLPVTMQALCGAGKSSNFAEALSARWAKKNAEDADWEDGVGEGVFHQGDWSISRETRLT